MTIANSVRLQKIHDECIAEFDCIQTAVRDVRLQCLSDRRFATVTGAQWEGDLGDQFENKPRFEINKVLKSVIRVYNEYRNQRYDVEFISKDGADVDELADSCAALYRADEQDSVADEAKDNAFEEGVAGGMGAFQLEQVYEDEDDEESEAQRIAWAPIVDADKCVFFDLNAKRQDKKDATTCYVLTGITRDSYIDEYEDDPSTWPVEITQCFFDWFTPDIVYLATVYKVEKKGALRHVFRSLTGEEQTLTPEDMEDDERLDELSVTGWSEVRQEKTKRRRIHKYIMSGGKVLEDCGYIAGSYIPVIVCYGKRWFVEGVERCMGQVRLGKDSQRLENMQKSKLAEISAYSTIEKPIVSPEQISGHSPMWETDNIVNYPYMLLNALRNPDGSIATTVPMAYTKVPNIPPAMVALLQLTQSDLKDLMGDEQSAEEVKSNISGKAVELVQGRLDMQAFIYISNFAKAVKYSGDVWLSMAKELYYEKGRKMRGLTKQGKPQAIELHKPVIGKDGIPTYANDLQGALLDVVVAVGPSSQSKRAATVRSVTAMMAITQDPQELKVLQAFAMMNMEGEGIEELNDYYRKQLVHMGVLKPTPEEEEELAEAQANAKPDPNAQFLLAEAGKAEALTVESLSKTALNKAKVEESQSVVVKNLAEVGLSDRQQIIDLATVLDEAAAPGT